MMNQSNGSSGTGTVRLRDERGSTLVIALVAVGVVSLLALAGTTWMMQLRSVGRRYMTKDAPRIFLMNMKGRLNNDVAWEQTRLASTNYASMNCLNDMTLNCCGTTNAPLAVFDQGGSVFYDGRGASTMGFNYSGDICSGFDPVNGNEECPFQAEIVWEAFNQGNSPNCKDARITVSFRYAPKGEQVPFNSNAVEGRIFVRGTTEGTLAAHCASIGGRFDQTSNDCKMPGTISQCGSGQFMIGYTSDGSPNCQPISVSMSPPCYTGQAVVSVGLSGGVGSMTCQQFPIRPPCPSNYHQIGSYCYFNVLGPCTVPGGTGLLTWNGGGFPCVAMSCNAGLVLMGGACVSPSTP